MQVILSSLLFFKVFVPTLGTDDALDRAETPTTEHAAPERKKESAQPVTLDPIDRAPTPLSVAGGVLLVLGAGTAAGSSIAASRADTAQQTPLLVAAAGGAVLFVAGAVFLWAAP
jgi:hypothetical protein